MFMKLTGVQKQVVITLCCYLGIIITGYSLSWSGPILPKLQDRHQSPIPYNLTDAQLSVIVTSIYFGSIPGPYVTLWLSNTKGRRPCLIIGGVLFAIAYTIFATTNHLAMLIIGRILTGAAMGTVNVINLVYIGEIASKNIRGILLTMIGILQTVGSILIFSIGPFVSYYETSYIGLALSIVFIFCVSWIPESPLFYTLQGKDKEAMTILQDLGRSEDKEKISKNKNEVLTMNTKKDWMELFTVRSNRKAFFVVFVINIFQSCSGALAIIFFSSTIFKMAGSSVTSDIAMIIIGCFQLVGSMVTPFIIERLGRKITLLISCALCSLSMFTFGIYFYLDHIGNSIINHIKWLPVLILILFYIGYESGLGIIPNIIIGEMFTSNVRSKGSTLTMTLSWLFGFGVNTAFGALLQTIGGYVAFWFFGCTCACAFIFTLVFIPETKGKTLKEIQDNL